MADSNPTAPLMSQANNSPTTDIPGLINQAPGQITTTPGTAPVGSGAPVTGYNPSTATSSPVGTANYTVSPDQTVASQIQHIITSGSPLMDQALANANDAMQARGLRNSSQAITAAQAGLIQTALPIAQQDAQTYNQNEMATAAAKNQALQEQAQLETGTSQFNTGQKNAAMQTAANASNAVQLAGVNNAAAQQLQEKVNQGNLANIQAQGTINVQLTNLQNQNKLLLQTSAGAAQYYAQALSYMSSISTSPNLTTDQKTNALNNAMIQLDSALSVMSAIGGTPDVSSLLRFTDGS